MSGFWNFGAPPGREGGPDEHHEPTNVEFELRALRDGLEKLALVCRAMWEMQAEAGGLDPRAILDKVSEIDLRDGEMDQRLKTPARECRGCGRKLARRRRTCLYCGADDPDADPFQVV